MPRQRGAHPQSPASPEPPAVPPTRKLHETYSHVQLVGATQLVGPIYPLEITPLLPRARGWDSAWTPPLPPSLHHPEHPRQGRSSTFLPRQPPRLLPGSGGLKHGFYFFFKGGFNKGPGTRPAPRLCAKQGHPPLQHGLQRGGVGWVTSRGPRGERGSPPETGWGSSTCRGDLKSCGRERGHAQQSGWQSGGAGSSADMGHLCHPQPPAAGPERGRRKGGDGAAPPGPPLLLLFVLLASSISACKGEHHPAGSAFLRRQLCAPSGSRVPAALGAGGGRAGAGQRLGTVSGIGLGGFFPYPGRITLSWQNTPATWGIGFC